MWFNGLPEERIELWTNFCERLSTHFIVRKRQSLIISTLSWSVQGKKESLRYYIDNFTQASNEVERTKEGLKCWIFENGLLRDHTFWMKIGRKKVRTTQEIVSMAQSYIILEEKLNMRFDNHIFVDTNFMRPTGKDSIYGGTTMTEVCKVDTRSTRNWTYPLKIFTMSMLTPSSGKAQSDHLTLSKRHLIQISQSTLVFINITTIKLTTTSNWRMSLKGW